MKSRIEIELDNDAVQQLSVKASEANNTISEYVESIVLDFLSPVATDTKQMELNISAEQEAEDIASTVEKKQAADKDLTRPPFNQHGEKPVPLESKKTTNLWVDPESKKTKNSWKF